MGVTRNISLEISLSWNSGQATHVDSQYFEKINLWRDYFPQDLGERLNVAKPGDAIKIVIGCVGQA